MSFFRTTAKKSLFLVFKNPLISNRYQKEISKRANLPLTSIQELSKHISVFSAFTKELQASNDWYGHATILKQYLNLPQDYQFKFIIEHGIVLSDHINNLEIDLNFPGIITASNFRVKVLKKIYQNACPIGPYIHYSPSFLSKEKLQEERKCLGNNLLVFPSHSTLDLKTNFDHANLIKKIKQVAKDFNSVRVCLYWKDINLGLAQPYIDAGFECVTAGHILDPLFLPRLKSIIELSSFTISNDAGTHVGYCVYMNKPHMIIPQMHIVKGKKSEEMTANYIYKSNPYKETVKAFSAKRFNINSKQREVIEKYWGLSQVKTEKELLSIVKQTESLFQKNQK